VTDALRRPGPGSGPGGAPTAIALSPILSARYRAQDLERIRAAAPGARIVTLSVEGLSDDPVDDVEVLLHGWLSAEAFDRLLARAPRLTWVHSASAGVERAVMRLTGMDVKMEQYRSGERFVRAIAAVGGATALRRLWEGPESMPRDDEIAQPEHWLQRVMPELAN